MLKKEITIIVFYNILFSIFSISLSVISIDLIYGNTRDLIGDLLLVVICLSILLIYLIIFRKGLVKKKMILIHLVNIFLFIPPLNDAVTICSLVLCLLKPLIASILIIFVNRKEYKTKKDYLDNLSYSSYICYLIFSAILMIYPYLDFIFSESGYPSNQGLYFLYKPSLYIVDAIQILFCLFCLSLFVIKTMISKKRNFFVSELVNVVGIVAFCVVRSIATYSEIFNKIGTPIILPFIFIAAYYNEFFTLLGLLAICVIFNILYRNCYKKDQHITI